MPDPWLRLGAAAGILYAALVVAGFGVAAASIGTLATLGSPDNEILRELERPSEVWAFVGLYLLAIAFLLFAVFAARLWAILRRAEGDPGWLSAAAFGSGMLYVALSLVSLVFIGAERLAAGRGIDIELARVLHALNSGTYIVSWGAAALFLSAAATVGLATRVLPRWLGWSAGALAVALLLAMAVPTLGLATIPPFLFVLWTLVAAIVLIRRSSELPASSAA